MQRKYWSVKKMMKSSSHSQMEQQNCQGETTNSEYPLSTEPTDDAEAHADLWSIQGDFIYRHHCERRVQLFVPKEETLLIPLKYIDVIRSAHTDLDVMQET